jgi:hypothetical protein
MLRLICFCLLGGVGLGMVAPGPAEKGRRTAADQRSDKGWTALFDGKDLRGWDVYLKAPIGLNNDPHRVFTVVKDGDEGVIRISGEDVGAISTKKEFGDYHLQLLFRWGSLSWGNKKGKKKDSGLLYHSVGPYGADYGAWMRSQEFQIQEGDCGDYWGCAGGMAAIPAVKANDSDYVYDPAGAMYSFRADEKPGRHCIKKGDAEKATGEWNQLDLYCYGDTSVHVVNGKVMMVLYRNAQVDSGNVRPLTRGKIQLQSEGAEVFYKQIRIKGIGAIPGELLR